MPDSEDRPPATGGLRRRDFLGLGLPAWCSLGAAARGAIAPDAPAQAIIHVFLPGGMSHVDSFDPKPFAPLEYRGPFRAVDTRIPGVQFAETFARTAAVADKLAVCRSLTHGEAAHERGTHNLFTGYRPSPALEYPSLGSVVAHELGGRDALPPYVCIPGPVSPYQGSGYLSSAYGPFALGDSPERTGFAVRDLALPPGVDPARVERRRALLAAVDQPFAATRDADALQAVDSFYRSAWELIGSPAAQEAFRIEAEPKDVRDRYGMHAPGQRLLLARRLVEAGVRFVSVHCGAFDFHDNLQRGMQRAAPTVDQAFAALLEDLDQRGRLDRTLVVLATEFGRTPKLNDTGGRDHWPRVFSILLAGGGIRRGVVHGASTALADAVESDPLGIEDLATTLYHVLGIDAQKELLAPGNRPIEIVKGGRVVPELVA